MSSEVSKSKYPYPSSETGGVRPLAIRGIFEDEKYRISEMFTDEERAWRKQWLKDQQLSPSEPRYVPELEKELRNPIRRFASVPWKFLEAKMTPVFGAGFSQQFRYVVPKLIVMIAVGYASYYHLKYNQNTWTSSGGWTVQMARPVAVPGDKDFPLKRDRFHPWDYGDRGFKSRKVFLDPHKY